MVEFSGLGCFWVGEIVELVVVKDSVNGVLNVLCLFLVVFGKEYEIR